MSDYPEVNFPRSEPKLEITMQMKCFFSFLRTSSQKKLRKWRKPNRIEYMKKLRKDVLLAAIYAQPDPMWSCRVWMASQSCSIETNWILFACINYWQWAKLLPRLGGSFHNHKDISGRGVSTWSSTINIWRREQLCAIVAKTYSRCGAGATLAGQGVGEGN